MSASKRRGMGKVDRELDAMAAILDALEGLEGESIHRVLDYVFGRLSIARPGRLQVAHSASVVPTGRATAEPTVAGRQPSIRDLREEKRPHSANQMAALVAYYLSEIAKEEERKEAISASDIEKYFKQAGFKLPKAIPQALPNAAAAGYLDATGNGLYRLNPVGYNLVVHGLPRDQEKTSPTGKRRTKRGRQ